MARLGWRPCFHFDAFESYLTAAPLRRRLSVQKCPGLGGLGGKTAQALGARSGPGKSQKSKGTNVVRPVHWVSPETAIDADGAAAAEEYDILAIPGPAYVSATNTGG